MRQPANSFSLPAADTQQSELRFFLKLPCASCQTLTAAYLTEISLDVQVERLDSNALFEQSKVFKSGLQSGKSCTERAREKTTWKCRLLYLIQVFPLFLISAHRSFSFIQAQSEYLRARRFDPSPHEKRSILFDFV